MSLLAKLAAAAGFSAVALGAFGAHALKPRLTELGTLDVWHTASLYHLVHAVALLALAALPSTSQSPGPVRSPRLCAWLWTAGILIFSGSLYILALTGLKPLGMITPIGGLCLLAGWACLALPAKKSAAH